MLMGDLSATYVAGWSQSAGVRIQMSEPPQPVRIPTRWVKPAEPPTMRALLFGLALSTLIAAPALACAHVTKGDPATASFTADIDAHLAKAQLADADLAKVRELRAKIDALVAENKFHDA